MMVEFKLGSTVFLVQVSEGAFHFHPYLTHNQTLICRNIHTLKRKEMPEYEPVISQRYGIKLCHLPFYKLYLRC